MASHAVRTLRPIVVSMMMIAGVPVATAGPVVVLELRDTIQPASLRYLERGLHEAARRDAALVIVELDTPGGLATSLRRMTTAIIASPVPVAVYVSPPGARAASAGFFVLLAADIAAMAPGTNTGAAHPVAIGAGAGSGESTEMGKVTNDAAALARAFAVARHRPAEPAERAVVASASYTADEALALRLVDLIAVDRAELILAIDHRKIARFDGRVETLALGDARVEILERTLAERVLGVIADPQIAYLLVVLGGIALLLELTHPGLVVPGIAGGLSILLGLYGLSILPVSVIGGALLVAGLALLVAEVFVTSYGLLAVAGIAAFILGSLMLVDAPIPELAIHAAVVVPVTIVLAGVTALLALRVYRSRRLRVQSGVDAMIGERGEVIAAIAPGGHGRVFVHGESWDATADEPLPAGRAVRVDAVEGLMVRVSRCDDQEEPRE